MIRSACFTLALLLAALLSAQTSTPLRGPLVSSDRWPRATSLVDWTRDVMRIEGLENASETAQGKAYFEWLRLFNRMAVGGMIQAYEGDYGRERYVTDAHKTLFVYGWGYCDTTSRIAEAGWKEFKRDAQAAQRVITQHADGGYHTMYRLRMDGRFGAFDPRYGYYLLDRDAAGARILDWSEAGVDENFQRNRAFRQRSRPFFEIAGLEWERALLIQPAWHESEAAWRAAGAPKENVFADSHYRLGTRFHDMDFRLPRGTTVERFWDNSDRSFYVPAGEHTKREFAFLPAGRFYRVTESSHHGNWPQNDPNYRRARPYLAVVPRGQGYPAELEGGRTIGQAWGRISYEPDLTRADFFDALLPGATLVHAPAKPFLRPRAPGEAGDAVFHFQSPYVLVKGELEVELAGDGVRVELRVQTPKNAHAAEPELWSKWQTVAEGAGEQRVELGRPRFNGSQASIHGAYAFQVRVSVAKQAGRTAAPGLSGFALHLTFENGLMSIPQIFAGANTIRFRLHDPAPPRAAVTVTYRYQTATGEKAHTRRLLPGEFRGGEAAYTLMAPGLLRCNALSIAY